MDGMNGDPLLQPDCVIVADNMNSVEDDIGMGGQMGIHGVQVN